MNRRVILGLIFLTWLSIPMGLTGVSPQTTTAQPDFTVSFSSWTQGNRTWTAAEFMAFPTIEGYANHPDYHQQKFTGVNVTWLLVTYGEYFENMSVKFTTPSGFTTTRKVGQLLHNATHCHILAYKMNDALLPNPDYFLQLMPICLNESKPITFYGSVNPWGIRRIEILNSGQTERSEYNVFIFFIIFMVVVMASMFGLVFVAVYLDKRKKKTLGA